MKIAVDFDGTIVEHRFPQIGKPKPMAFDVLKALSAEGHQLILWSNREGKHLEDAINFCRENGVEFYSVNSDYPDASWSGSGVSRKLVADIYIDDKNLGGLPDWDKIYSMISEQKSKDVFHEKQKKVLPGSSGHSHSHHHHHRHKSGFVPGFLTLLIDRCRQARDNFRI